MARGLKLIGAVLLASCFALPMSSCAQVVDDEGMLVSTNPDGSIPTGAHKVMTRHHVLDQVEFNHPTTWLYVAAFVWPLVFLLHAWIRPAARLNRALWFTEPLLLAGSSYAIFLLTFLERPEVGSHVGEAGIAVYLLGWISGAVDKWRSWRRRRLTSA